MTKRILATVLLIAVIASPLAALGKETGGLSINGGMRTTWGLNFDQKDDEGNSTITSGFSSRFLFDVAWNLLPWEKISSGGEWEGFNVSTDVTAYIDAEYIGKGSGWKPKQNLEATINFSEVVSTISYSDFYLLVGAEAQDFDARGNQSFSRARDMIRANWAQLQSRIPTSYILSSDWQVDGASDNVNGADDAIQGANAGIGLGIENQSISAILMVGSEDDWKSSEHNAYDIGYNVDLRLIPGLGLRQGSFVKLDEDTTPLKVGIGADYSVDLGNGFALVPYVGFDAAWSDLRTGVMDGSELAYGLTFSWPGPNGYGYLPSYNEESGPRPWARNTNRYSGVTLSGINLFDNSPNSDQLMHLSLSVFDATEGGLVEGLGLTGLFELKDITGARPENAFGLWVNYKTPVGLVPFAEVKKTTYSYSESESKDVAPLFLKLGATFTSLPGAELEVRYENDDLTDAETPGRVLFEIRTFL